MNRLMKFTAGILVGFAALVSTVAINKIDVNAATVLGEMEYTIPDIRKGTTVEFHGDDGKAKVISFGGICSCGICIEAERNINELVPKMDPSQVDVYFIDTKENPISDINRHASREGFSDRINIGTVGLDGYEDYERGTKYYDTYMLYYLCYKNTIRSGGYTMPLIVYIDGDGNIVSYTNGHYELSLIKSNLDKLGVTYDGTIKPVYGTGIYLYNGQYYLFEDGVQNTSYIGAYYSESMGCFLYLDHGRVCFEYTGVYFDPQMSKYIKVTAGVWDSTYSDLYMDPQYGWLLVQSGCVDFDYDGMYCSPTLGWWKVLDGRIDFGYNDLYCDSRIGWWKIAGGTIDWGYQGLYMSPTIGWWKISGGTIDFAYNDLYCDPLYGWWKVTGGSIDLGYNGLYCSPLYGWWLILGGGPAFGYSGLYCDATYGWWKINCGTMDFGFNDLYCDPVIGWWKVVGGTIDFGYTGLYCSPTYGWWLVQFGMLNTTYTGYYADPLYGTYYLVNGYIDFYHVD